ncbi:MAG: hypothetical protein J4452_00325 [Candidatus Aenigmarchaeota archaeon]|nr:hypothetical protein [Candidatus Aenigmarchaeota archaeon]
MTIEETFGRTVNISINKGMNESLKFLKISNTKLEETIRKKKKIIEDKSYDLLIDYKPKINHLYLYLSPKKSSKKTLKTLKPNSLEFKSLVILIGSILLFGKRTEVRLGAIGPTSSELARAVIEHKKV